MPLNIRNNVWPLKVSCQLAGLKTGAGRLGNSLLSVPPDIYYLPRMVESSIFDEIPEEISTQLVSFSEATDDVEQLVNKISSFSNTSDNQVSDLDTIKSELSLCYAFNALFFMYLRCNGVETQSHPIMQELVSSILLFNIFRLP
ncbi:unnamed protein product [Heterobilharzia americana]|nr:unnamed protein product [Heterobilharzia americana]